MHSPKTNPAASSKSFPGDAHRHRECLDRAAGDQPELERFLRYDAVVFGGARKSVECENGRLNRPAGTRASLIGRHRYLRGARGSARGPFRSGL